MSLETFTNSNNRQLTNCKRHQQDKFEITRQKIMIRFFGSNYS